MHEAEEVSRGLFVARRDAAVVLDSVHETLDQVPFFVQVLVVVSRLLAVALGRNGRLCSVRFNGLDEGVAVIARVGQDGAQEGIPPKSNRKEPRDYDKNLYKERNLVERFMNRIKHYRRVATRYEKTARNFLGFVHVAAIMVLLQ